MSTQVGQVLNLAITDMTTDGAGIGRTEEGYTLFVKGALPGDKVKARVTYCKKAYGFADTLDVTEASPDRIPARCPVADRCGGCTLQTYDYQAQLAFKRKEVENVLSRIGGIDVGCEVEVQDVIGMDEPFRYRNKSQYPVGRNTKGRIVCGFYESKSHHIIPIRECYLSPLEDRMIIAAVLDFLEIRGIEPYDETSGKGLLRHILIRKGFTTGEIMVCLIVNGRKFPGVEDLAQMLKDLVPGVKSVCLNVNTKRNNVILGEEVISVLGDPFITDYIGDLSFRISPLSFYQVNPVQTKKLYDTVKEFAALTGNETVLDLYCGIGTIGLYLSDKAKEVYGVEIVPQAIKDAKENAERNGVKNAHFSVGASEDIFENLPKADLTVLDPPRKGCDEKLLRDLIEKGSDRIVYVSCNPSTLARDIKILKEGGYKLEAVRPCDMFPQTCHVETVVLMSKVNTTK
ncbi:MAG: 23S rRNA (uracil(1939)-C(5))-methyltransferase RlmD [Lachnospiraceae bacterium]|nr:23S rRNA (uracil(1939)-C(5))-methyltransferase RlmD [Candidatus Equihabitans merdae]